MKRFLLVLAVVLGCAILASDANAGLLDGVRSRRSGCSSGCSVGASGCNVGSSSGCNISGSSSSGCNISQRAPVSVAVPPSANAQEQVDQLLRRASGSDQAASQPAIRGRFVAYDVASALSPIDSPAEVKAKVLLASK